MYEGSRHSRYTKGLHRWVYRFAHRVTQHVDWFVDDDEDNLGLEDNDFQCLLIYYQCEKILRKNREFSWKLVKIHENWICLNSWKFMKIIKSREHFCHEFSRVFMKIDISNFNKNEPIAPVKTIHNSMEIPWEERWIDFILKH